MKKINNDEEYEKALEELLYEMDGTDDERIEELAQAIEIYEDIMFPDCESIE